jgi:hypothetical protein
VRVYPRESKDVSDERPYRMPPAAVARARAQQPGGQTDVKRSAGSSRTRGKTNVMGTSIDSAAPLRSAAGTAGQALALEEVSHSDLARRTIQSATQRSRDALRLKVDKELLRAAVELFKSLNDIEENDELWISLDSAQPSQPEMVVDRPVGSIPRLAPLSSSRRLPHLVVVELGRCGR